MTTDPRLQGVSATGTDIDAGLQQFMRGVYNTMCFGLIITGATAYLVFRIPALHHFFFSFPMVLVTLFAPLAFLMLGLTPQAIYTMPINKVRTLFSVYSAIMGISLSALIGFAAPEGLARVFFITAATFAGTSYYGYTTKRNLDSLTGFLGMGALGLLIAMIVNLFMHSATLQYVMSGIGVIVFTGVTAWETHILKESYSMNRGMEEANERLAISGALTLYMSFINLFQYILNLSMLADRRQ